MDTAKIEFRRQFVMLVQDDARPIRRRDFS